MWLHRARSRFESQQKGTPAQLTAQTPVWPPTSRWAKIRTHWHAHGPEAPERVERQTGGKQRMAGAGSARPPTVPRLDGVSDGAVANSREARSHSDNRPAGRAPRADRPPAPFSIAIVFSEPVTGFELEDLVVGNGSASELQGNNATCTVTITPAASGTVTVDIAAGASRDRAGSTSAAADQFSIVAELTPVPALPMAGAVALAVLLLVGGVRRWAARLTADPGDSPMPLPFAADSLACARVAIMLDPLVHGGSLDRRNGVDDPHAGRRTRPWPRA